MRKSILLQKKKLKSKYYYGSSHLSTIGGDNIRRIIILELPDHDSKAFDEILTILRSYPEIEKYELAGEPILSLPGLEIYPSKRKVFRDRQEIQLTAKV